MSTSKIIHSKKSKSSQSNPAPAAHSANAPASSLDTLADAMIAHLDSLEKQLDLDIVVRPNDKAQMRTLSRVSAEAIATAADIAAADPDRFRDFDVQGLGHAAEYTRAMTRVLVRVTELAQHVQKSIQNQRYPACQQTLALYATLKGLGRVLENEVLREKTVTLGSQLAVRRNAKKLTNEQKAERRIAKQKAKRIAKAKAVLAASSSPASTSSAETPGATRAAPSPTTEVAVTLNGAHSASLS